jgi:hypothetical protein
VPASRGANPEISSNHRWTARVKSSGVRSATAYVRTQSFTVFDQASFRDADPHPSAVEYLLGALGGDLLNGFAALAARRGVLLDGLEASLSGHLNNPLMFLGSVGESGHPGFEAIDCTLHVVADADTPTLDEIWREVLARSPLLNTLQRCVAVSVNLQVML